MFKKPFTNPQKSKLKSSAQRAVRAKVASLYPLLEPHLDTILPKKSQLDVLKLPDRLTLYVLDGQCLFFQHFDDALIPHLRICHQYPECFPMVQVDLGAARFLMQGVNMMCPGFLNAGGEVGEDLNVGDVVCIRVQGRESAAAVGVMKLSGKDVKAVGKGVAVEVAHYLGDYLWKYEGDS